MMVPYHQPHEPHIECPQCRRHSIVKYGESEYVCLNCDYRRDLSRPYFDGFSWISMVLFGLFLAVLMAG